MNDLKLRRIVMRNFLSYGNNETAIDLSLSTPTLIIGRNFDQTVDGQLDSNGAGKTTILNAIAVAAFDKAISDIEKNDLVNHTNLKNMYVCLDFTQNGTFYRVERYRKNKAMGGDGVRIMRRDADDNFDPSTDDVTPDSIANANEYIRRVVGMPFDVFSRIAIFSAAHQPFLSLPSSHASRANQKDIIEELFGITELSEKAELLKIEIKANKEKFERIEEVNTTLKRERANHNNTLAALSIELEEWNARRAADISAARKKLEDLSEIDFDEQLELLAARSSLRQTERTLNTSIPSLVLSGTKLEAKLAEATTWGARHDKEVKVAEDTFNEFEAIDYEVEEAKLVEVDEANKEIQDIRASILELKQTIHDDGKVIGKLEEELSHLQDSKCPYCSQNYAEAMVKRDAIDLQLLELRPTQKANNKKLTNLENSLDDAEGNLAVMKRGLKFKSLRELTSYSKDYEHVSSNLTRLMSATNPYNVKDIEDELETILAEITESRKKLTKVTKSIAEIGELVVFESEAAAASAKTEMKNLTTRVDELLEGRNPHQNTYDRLSKMQFEDLKDDELNELDDTLEHQQFLLKLLTKKDSFVRKLLLQKNLPFLNGRLKIYLGRLGLPHRVTFKEDLSVAISQFGATLKYGNLSSGQRARINLALCFAFRDVLQARHGKMNFCILDECLDTGLSNVGVQMAADMIKRVAIDEKLSMFVISHRDEIASMFSARLIVELRNGFSQIVDE